MKKATEISRTFRPRHKDVEVVLEDAHGARFRMYLSLAAGSPDISQAIRKRLTEMDEEADRIEVLLKKHGLK